MESKKGDVEELGLQDVINMTIGVEKVGDGDIQLPPGLKTYKQAIAVLMEKEKEENSRYVIAAEFPCAPLDGLMSFHLAMVELYKWVATKEKTSFFGKQPPAMLNVPVSVNKTVQLMYGQFVVPAIGEGYLETYLLPNKFLLSGVTIMKYKPEVERIIERIAYNLKHRSIYLGNAIELDLSWMSDSDHDFNPFEDAPKFIDLSATREDMLVLNDRNQDEVDVGIFYPIDFYDEMRAVGNPEKRTVVLAGEYGVGKSMMASIVAVKATRMGMTFINLKDVKYLKEGLEFARIYSGAKGVVVFAEDVDAVMSGEERTLDINTILNTISGVRDLPIISVFTTNHPEKITRAMRRFGRVDAFIVIERPDAKSALRLVRNYIGDFMAPNQDLSEVSKALEGQLPATIAEVCNRAKIAAIGALKTSDIKGRITTEHLLKAAASAQSHIEYMSQSSTKVPTDSRTLVEVPAQLLTKVSQLVGAS